MPILGRPTLVRYFETGKALSNQAFNALVDSFLSSQDATAQELPSNITINQVVVSGQASAGDVKVTEVMEASAANFEGIVAHGSGTTLGAFVIAQESTAETATTAQIALLPNSANIVGLGVKVLRHSSGGEGGTEIRIGNGAAIDYFGTVTVSAAGVFKFTNVCARRLQGASGAVYAAGITATAASSFVPYVEYYRTTAASQSTEVVEISSFTSAIGNMDAGGGLAAAFDGVTSQIAASGARVASARGFIGQAWDSPKKIMRAIIYDPNNDGLSGAAFVVVLRIRGGNSNSIDSATVLASVNTTYVVPTTAYSFMEADIDTTNAYPYHWVEMSAAGVANLNIAEIRLWELV